MWEQQDFPRRNSRYSTVIWIWKKTIFNQAAPHFSPLISRPINYSFGKMSHNVKRMRRKLFLELLQNLMSSFLDFYHILPPSFVEISFGSFCEILLLKRPTNKQTEAENVGLNHHIMFITYIYYIHFDCDLFDCDAKLDLEYPLIIAKQKKESMCTHSSSGLNKQTVVPWGRRKPRGDNSSPITSSEFPCPFCLLHHFSLCIWVSL